MIVCFFYCTLSTTCWGHVSEVGATLLCWTSVRGLDGMAGVRVHVKVPGKIEEQECVCVCVFVWP